MHHVNVFVAAIASAPGDGNSTFNTLKMYNRNISLVVCCISSSSTDSLLLLLLPGEWAVLYWSLNNNLEYSTTIIAHTQTQSLFIHSEMPMVLLHPQPPIYLTYYHCRGLLFLCLFLFSFSHPILCDEISE